MADMNEEPGHPGECRHTDDDNAGTCAACIWDRCKEAERHLANLRATVDEKIEAACKRTADIVSDGKAEVMAELEALRIGDTEMRAALEEILAGHAAWDGIAGWRVVEIAKRGLRK